MKRVLAALLCLALGGCITLPSSKTYTPIFARLVNKAQYDADLEECHWTADNYSPGATVSTVAQQGFIGGTNDGAVAVINPLTVAGGAIGGALNGLASGYDLSGQDSIKILVLCIAKETALDGSAIIADPHE